MTTTVSLKKRKGPCTFCGKPFFCLVKVFPQRIRSVMRKSGIVYKAAPRSFTSLTRFISVCLECRLKIGSSLRGDDRE